MFKKILALLALAFALTVSAAAQEFSTPNFSAVFNGPVTVTTENNPTNTTTRYASYANGVSRIVYVRFIDHDIAVNYTSSDFYANDTDNTIGTVLKTSQDSYYGHPFTYSDVQDVVNGVTMWTRTRYIIVNSREAIFIREYSPEELSNFDSWVAFENTLVIK